MSAVIINRGRGPEIAGTRITVYDILDYTTRGHDPAWIASLFDLSPVQVLAAVRYVEEHKDEVMPAYQRILERAAQGNPPEVRARLEASHARLQARLVELAARKQARQEVNGEGHLGRQ